MASTRRALPCGADHKRVSCADRGADADDTSELGAGASCHRRGHSLNVAGYEGYLGRWSRLFVPSLLAEADVAAGHRVLDVATGPGEAAAFALGQVGRSGLVVGADVAPSMLDVAVGRFAGQRFVSVATDGQALPFADEVFDSVICQLGLMFFPDPGRGLQEFRRVLRPGRRAAVCVIST